MKLVRVSFILVLAMWCLCPAHAGFLIDPTGGTILWSDKTDVDDEVKIGRSLGFPFSFFGGDSVRTIDISVNGHLNFSGNSDDRNELDLNSIPRISPLWDDLCITAGSGDAVIEKLVAGSYYSVTWRVHGEDLPDSKHAFQVVLFGKAMRVNGIDFQKGDIVFSYEGIGPRFDKKTATVSLDPGDFLGAVPFPRALLPTGQLREGEAAGLLPLTPGGFVLYRFDGADSYAVSIFGNRPPRARADTVYAANRSALNIKALENDDDPDGDVPTVTDVSKPEFGTVTVDENGVLHYVAGKGFRGKDEFTYTITDPSAVTATARVKIIPFAPNKETFEGFIRNAPTEDEPAPEVTPEGAGFLRLTFRQKGAFSGKMYLGGFVRTLVGAFDMEGNYKTTYERIVDEEPQTVTITLHLDLLNDTQPLTGTITYGEASSVVAASRSLYNARTAPAPQAGPYKVLLFPDESGGPAGIGFGNMKVLPNGTVKITGKFGNGQALSHSGSIKPDGAYPVYVHLPGAPKARAGAFWGSVKFDDTDLTSDCVASLRWFTPDTEEKTGFDAVQALIGDRHVPAKGKRVLTLPDEPSNATIDLSGAGIFKTLAVDTANKVRVEEVDVEKLTVTIDAAKWSFSGSFVEESWDYPGVFKKRKFVGGLLKKSNIGGGFYKDAEGSAAPVIIQPPPAEEF